MNIFKNYKRLKDGNIEEFPAISIRYADTEVFAELPVCIVPYEGELKNPMLFREQNGIGVAIERTKLLEILATQRVFHLKKNSKGELKEVDANKAEYHYRLPKDTDIKELDIVDGQLLKIEKKLQDETVN